MINSSTQTPTSVTPPYSSSTGNTNIWLKIWVDKTSFLGSWSLVFDPSRCSRISSRSDGFFLAFYFLRDLQTSGSSSEPSGQSFSRSQRQPLEIHVTPSLHTNCFGLQLLEAERGKATRENEGKNWTKSKPFCVKDLYPIDLIRKLCLLYSASVVALKGLNEVLESCRLMEETKKRPEIYKSLLSCIENLFPLK